MEVLTHGVRQVLRPDILELLAGLAVLAIEVRIRLLGLGSRGL